MTLWGTLLQGISPIVRRGDRSFSPKDTKISDR